MMRKVLLSIIPISLRQPAPAFQCVDRRPFSDGSRRKILLSEFPRLDSLVNGCDYNHWLVVMHPPDDYPHREEIIRQYIGTLAMALGSEKAAMESIYSVSTKYYYAFGCKVTAQVTNKIKLLPRVKWVLPDSYLSPEESYYGGEPYINGKVVPYEEKYHADWLHQNCNEDCTERTHSRKPRRRRTGTRNPHERNERSD